LLHLKKPVRAFSILHLSIAGEFFVKYVSDGCS
jgi:hypothetical protein